MQAFVVASLVLLCDDFGLLEFNVPPTPKRIMETGTEIPGGGGGGGLYIALHCHHQNDIALSWAAMGDILMFH